jgi:hypothetical protein
MAGEFSTFFLSPSNVNLINYMKELRKGGNFLLGNLLREIYKSFIVFIVLSRNLPLVSTVSK